MPDIQTTCNCCSTLCNALSAEIAKINYHLLSLKLFQEVTQTSMWMLKQGFTTKSCIYVNNGVIMYVNLNNNNTLPCFCQRMVMNSTTPGSLHTRTTGKHENTTSENNNTGMLKLVKYYVTSVDFSLRILKHD